jgi:hypothetical protein
MMGLGRSIVPLKDRMLRSKIDGKAMRNEGSSILLDEVATQ